MNYEDRIVAFIDILGFKEYVSQSLDALGAECNDKTIKILAALEGLHDVLDVDEQQKTTLSPTVTQFSDSVILSFPVNQESGVFDALLYILWAQMSLVMHGFLSRGGVSRGLCLHTPKILFGPAINSAYELESKVAIYPRVILGEGIVQAGIDNHAKHHLKEHEHESILSLLKKDTDGFYYLDYVTAARSELNDPVLDHPAYLHSLGRLIEDGLRSPQMSVSAKCQWLRERFTPHLLQIKERVAVSLPIDDDLRVAYENISAP